jgi:DNA mismatch endonuclease (patch repair protein)
MDRLTSHQRSKNMKAIKSLDTKSEVLLAKTLWHRGNRYRKHVKSIFGTPDLSFKKYKIAVFVDSEFFHGKNWDDVSKRPKSNPEFWEKKILRNIQRDKEVNEYLINHGWTVLRFWSEDIKKNLYKIVQAIEKEITEKKNLINYKSKLIVLPSGNYLQEEKLPQAAEPSERYSKK